MEVYDSLSGGVGAFEGNFQVGSALSYGLLFLTHDIYQNNENHVMQVPPAGTEELQKELDSYFIPLKQGNNWKGDVSPVPPSN